MVFPNIPFDDKCYGITKRDNDTEIRMYHLFYNENDPSILKLKIYTANGTEKIYNLNIPFRMRATNKFSISSLPLAGRYEIARLNPELFGHLNHFKFKSFDSFYNIPYYEINIPSSNIKTIVRDNFIDKNPIIEILNPKIMVIPQLITGNDEIYISCVTKIEYDSMRIGSQYIRLYSCMPTICKFVIDGSGYSIDPIVEESAPNWLNPDSFSYIVENPIQIRSTSYHNFFDKNDINEDIPRYDFNFTLLSTISNDKEVFTRSTGVALDLEYNPTTEEIFVFCASNENKNNTIGQKLYIYKSKMNSLFPKYDIRKITSKTMPYIEHVSQNTVISDCNLILDNTDKLCFSFSLISLNGIFDETNFGFLNPNHATEWNNVLGYHSTPFQHCKPFNTDDGLYIGLSNSTHIKIAEIKEAAKSVLNLIKIGVDSKPLPLIHFADVINISKEFINYGKVIIKQYYFEQNTIKIIDNYIYSNLNKTYDLNYTKIINDNKSKYNNRASVVNITFNRIDNRFYSIGIFKSINASNEELNMHMLVDAIDTSHHIISFKNNLNMKYNGTNYMKASFDNNLASCKLEYIKSESITINTVSLEKTPSSAIFNGTDNKSTCLKFECSGIIKRNNGDTYYEGIQRFDTNRIILGLFKDGNNIINDNNIIIYIQQKPSNNFDLYVFFNVNNDVTLTLEYLLNIFITDGHGNCLGFYSNLFSSNIISIEASLFRDSNILYVGNNEKEFEITWNKNSTTKLYNFRFETNKISTPLNISPILNGTTGNFNVNIPEPGKRCKVYCNATSGLLTKEIKSNSIINVTGHTFKLNSSKIFFSDVADGLFSITNNITNSIRNDNTTLKVIDIDKSAHIGIEFTCNPNNTYEFYNNQISTTPKIKTARICLINSFYLGLKNKRTKFQSNIYNINNTIDGYPNTNNNFAINLINDILVYKNILNLDSSSLTNQRLSISINIPGPYYIILIIGDEFDQYSSYMINNMDNGYKFPLYKEL